MLPTRYSSLFRNRWVALMWAAGVCWSAVEFTGCSETAAPDATMSAQNSTSASDAESLQNLQALVGEFEK